MKKISTLLLLIFISSKFLPAQQTFSIKYVNGVYIFGDNNLYYENSKMKEKKIASKQVTYLKRNKQTYAVAYKYDEKGRSITEEYYNHRNKLGTTYRHEYDDKGHETVNELTYSNYARKVVKEYGPYKLPLKVITYKGTSLKNLVISRTVLNTFNEDGNISSSQTLDGKGKLVGKVNYTYDASKKLGEAKMYNKKGELKFTWNFSCDPEGKVEKKGETKTCTSREELPNGHYKEITIEYETNLVNKEITEYDENGKWVSRENYSGKDGSILISKNESTRLGGDSLRFTYSYYAGVKNNYLEKRTEYLYANGKTVFGKTEEYKRKNKLSSSKISSFTYNDDGLVSKESITDNVKHVMSGVNYSYTKY